VSSAGSQGVELTAASQRVHLARAAHARSHSIAAARLLPCRRRSVERSVQEVVEVLQPGPLGVRAAVRVVG
jgi:hypothetical protein